MRRYWIDPNQKKENLFFLEGDVFHHICHVCRQSVGSQFELITGDGLAYRVEIVTKKKGRAVVEILDQRQMPRLSGPKIQLVLGIPRFNILDKVIEKSVELGVSAIHLAATEFSFCQADFPLEKKYNRWEKIIISATQQSGRGERMVLHKIKPIDEILEKMNLNSQSRGLFFYEGDGGQSLKQALLKIKDSGLSEELNLYCFVGGEGGFSESELVKFKSREMSPISLGDQVLRVETACVALVSILKYELNGGSK